MSAAAAAGLPEEMALRPVKTSKAGISRAASAPAVILVSSERVQVLPVSSQTASVDARTARTEPMAGAQAQLALRMKSHSGLPK